MKQNNLRINSITNQTKRHKKTNHCEIQDKSDLLSKVHWKHAESVRISPVSKITILKADGLQIFKYHIMILYSDLDI